VKIRRVSFGGTAAIVTSMALVAGLDATSASRATVITALLIAAVADNLTDSLSIHVYQESERLEPRDAFVGTLSNFAARLAGCLTFVLIVALSPPRAAFPATIAWGMALLAVLTFLVARERRVGAGAEIAKHLGVACAVLVVSRAIAEAFTRG